ncbi:MAG TPA: XRE family transcriptional regulator [Candidatus Acidoferrales bacterium]|nr:XRE family transcriptional regulator [Candidatus Acidoferrales bacterium]
MNPKSAIALPNPTLLVWARESLKLDQEAAAKKLRIKVERIVSWESGTSKPTLSQLRKMADLYKRPLAVFYLPERPKDFQPLRDFRRASLGLNASLTPNLVLAIRRARDRRDWALELYDALGEGPPEFGGSLKSDIATDDAASAVRKTLGIKFEVQTQWATAYDALRNWRLAVEAAGILTFQASDLETREARGFSLSDRPLPVAVANVKDAPRGRIFTFLHEVVHIMLNESGICDVIDDRQHSSPTAQVETYCNQVAGAALFPLTEFMASAVVRSHKKGDPRWRDAELRDLSRRFGGSREAGLVRLLSLRLTTWDYYLEKRDELYKQYQEAQKNAKGFAAPHTVAVSNAGLTFTKLVLDGLSQNRINASDFSDYLQLRVKHLPEVQRDVQLSTVR